MPPTDSIEKPPTVELTAGPIAVFSNSYARLPEHFFARVAPTPVPKPRLIKFNESLASELGVDAQSLEADELAAVFAGNVIPPGAEPIALAYAGHQFGHFVPQLGDGRAILLGEVLDRSGERRDVQLKGAGRTPFSDNTALSGETIDFGPCAFMDSYDPATAFSAIDESGRYAYANQPIIAQWNLARFAETLLPLVDPNPERAVELASEAVSAFTSRYQEHWLAGMRDKLGIASNEDCDLDLVRELLQAMHENAADFTLTFHRLCAAAADEMADAEARGLFANPGAYDIWAARWRSRLAVDGREPNARAKAMRAVNPAFIPRNHLVEQALDAAIDSGDFSPFADLLTVLSRPYEDQPAFAEYANPPQTAERVFRTFCGT